jgi:hypothetical protein
MGCQFEWAKSWLDYSTPLWFAVIPLITYFSIGSHNLSFDGRATREFFPTLTVAVMSLLLHLALFKHPHSVELTIAVRKTRMRPLKRSSIEPVL